MCQKCSQAPWMLPLPVVVIADGKLRACIGADAISTTKTKKATPN